MLGPFVREDVLRAFVRSAGTELPEGDGVIVLAFPVAGEVGDFRQIVLASNLPRDVVHSVLGELLVTWGEGVVDCQ